MPLSHSTNRKVSFRRLLSCVLLSFVILLCTACAEEQPPTKVDLTKRVPNEQLQQISNHEHLNFGIGSMITPKEGHNYYRQLIEYVATEMGRSVKVIDRGTYDEFNTLLEQKEIDIAFVCGGPYIEGHETFGLELLALPEMAHGPIYFSYLIVPANSPARKLEDLRGKVFAFTDPKSNSGKIAPTYWLAQLGETPDSFFSKQIFTYAHDASIQAVIDNLVDAAAVDSLIWEYLNNKNPEVGVKTRIIKRSAPFGIPPLVIRPGLPETIRIQLRNILFTMHENPAGKKILEGMLIRRFIPGADSDYNSIREMREFVAQQKKGSS